MEKFYGAFMRDDGSNIKPREILSLVNCATALVHTAVPSFRNSVVSISGSEISAVEFTENLLASILEKEAYELTIQLKSEEDPKIVAEFYFNSKDRSAGTIFCAHPLASEMFEDTLPQVYFERLKVGFNYFHAIKENFAMIP